MLKETTSHHGLFQLHEQEMWGELVLAGGDSALTLRTQQKVAEPSAPYFIQGRLHDFKLVSCIDCVGSDLPNLEWDAGGDRAITWSIFPHHVLVGRSHFDPVTDRIRKVWFSTGDIYHIFDDFDAFGVIAESPPEERLRSLIPTTIGDRATPIGEHPIFAYFAGKDRLLHTQLPFGSFKLVYLPIPQSDSSGASIKNEIRIQIDFEDPIDFATCLKRISSVGQFLSLVAGRSQGVENVQIEIDGAASDTLPLAWHWSLCPQQAKGQDIDTPSWRDIPLDGIRRPEEFTQVLQAWFAGDKHAVARARLHSCRSASNHYTVDRLVAAANLFDLTNSVAPSALSTELAQACLDCLTILKAAPKSDERGEAIGAIKRVGGLTLKKKVMARADIFRGQFKMPDLDEVLRQAVLCRNYFVHGPGGSSFNYKVVEPHTPFLTETLEFVFAAAELVECGWAASTWRQRPHTGRHWFSRFTEDYGRASQELLSDIARAKLAGGDPDDD